MAHQLQLKIIEENSIRESLDSFRASFKLVCAGRSVSYSPDALGQQRRDLNRVSSPRRRQRQSGLLHSCDPGATPWWLGGVLGSLSALAW